MSKGIGDYNFEAKNAWRSAVWDEVARRRLTPVSDRVLYLAGPQNRDAAEAVPRGFQGKNLIAVEADRRRAEALRADGVRTIQADLLDVMQFWPESRRVGVVIADFCYGLEPDCIDLLDLLATPPFLGATCVINLQRGRDSRSARLRQIQEQMRPVLDQSPMAGLIATVSPKHRALMYLQAHATEMVLVAAGHGATKGTMQMSADPKLAAVAAFNFAQCRPRFFSYGTGPNGAVKMDSAVFSHPLSEASRALRRRVLRTDAPQRARHRAARPEKIQRQVQAEIHRGLGLT